MKTTLLLVILLGSAFAHAKLAENFIKQTMHADIEDFAQKYENTKIRIIDSNIRMSINPLQWLMMVKDVASGETRRVMTFNYSEDGSEEIKKGYLVMTYERQPNDEFNEEECYEFSVSKIRFDTGNFNLSGTIPGFTTIRTIEKCIGES